MEHVEGRPQGLIAFQYGGGSGNLVPRFSSLFNTTILKSEKTLGTRLPKLTTQQYPLYSFVLFQYSFAQIKSQKEHVNPMRRSVIGGSVAEWLGRRT